MKNSNLVGRSAFGALVVIITMLAAVRPAMSALESTIPILDRGAIKSLIDDKLLDNYIDVIVELKAIEAFHTTSGFTPKEYDNYKALLRYKILLLNEIEDRKLKVPHLDGAGAEPPTPIKKELDEKS